MLIDLNLLGYSQSTCFFTFMKCTCIHALLEDKDNGPDVGGIQAIFEEMNETTRHHAIHS